MEERAARKVARRAADLGDIEAYPIVTVAAVLEFERGDCTMDCFIASQAPCPFIGGTTMCGGKRMEPESVVTQTSTKCRAVDQESDCRGGRNLETETKTESEKSGRVRVKVVRSADEADVKKYRGRGGREVW